MVADVVAIEPGGRGHDDAVFLSGNDFMAQVDGRGVVFIRVSIDKLEETTRHVKRADRRAVLDADGRPSFGG